MLFFVPSTLKKSVNDNVYFIFMDKLTFDRLVYEQAFLQEPGFEILGFK